MDKKTLYIHTIGCQMNVYDSDRMKNSLRVLGYDPVDAPEQAGLIIVNTCAIREKAEQKVFSYLGRLSILKQKNPGLIIAAGGCVAQQEAERMLKRVPELDLVFGTHAVDRLPRLIERIETERVRLVDVRMSESIPKFQPDLVLKPETESGPGRIGAGRIGSGGIGSDKSKIISRFITIMQGCDNYCAYCVVPHVRGREMSRAAEDILEEISLLVKSGVREITLLGQNVNSYGRKQGLCTFPELLEKINAVNGLARIRFTTSHPKDLSDTLIRSFNTLDKLCRHIHLPVQSGSDRILKKMNRKYTRAHYIERIASLRRACPDIAITSDIIVGFPDETEQDFHDTLDLMRTVGFDSLFAFKYSDRPSAPASRFPEKVPEAVKKDRLKQLLELQEHFTKEKNRALVGTCMSVLIDGYSKKQEPAREIAPPIQDQIHNQIQGRINRQIQMSGRTSDNKIVNFFLEPDTGFVPDDLTGRLAAVHIREAFAHSLWGTLEEKKPIPGS